MTETKVIDLRTQGKNFALWSAQLAPEDAGEYLTVAVNNNDLAPALREEVEVIFTALTGQELPMGEDDFTFMVSYKDRVFNRIVYPSIMKGDVDNEEANDPNALYLRWGNTFYPLDFEFVKASNKYRLVIKDHNGEPLEFLITAYDFHNPKYLDPSLQFEVAHGDDIYVMNIPVKVDQSKVEQPEGDEKPDYVILLRAAMKRGAEAFLDLLLSGKEYKGYGDTLQPSELVPGKVYNIVDYVNFTSKNGRSVSKLIAKDDDKLVEIWCPYSLVNYIFVEPEITEENPVGLVYKETVEEVSSYNGKTYNVDIVGFDHPDGNIQAYGLDALEGKDLDAFIAQTEELITVPYRFKPTLSDNQLDVGVVYKVISYEKRNKGASFKLNMVSPSGKPVTIWCPNKIVPTLKLNPVINSENPATFQVVRKFINYNGNESAVSQLTLSPGSVNNASLVKFK